MRTPVPEPLLRHHERAVPPGVRAASCVRIRQRGQMWPAPGARPRRFAAVEDFAADRVAFSWRARFRLGPIPLSVVDEVRSGRGRLDATLAGVVPLMRQRGTAVDEGEAIRYLAELAWVPQAITANPALTWQAIDDRSAEVSTDVGGRSVAVRVTVGEDGLIETVFAERPALEGKTVAVRPWSGHLLEYGTVGGLAVPRWAEVRWHLPDGPFTYWRGETLGLVLDPPDARV